MAEFKDLQKGQRVYFTADQAAFKLLDAITPVEAALSVPYIRIYRIDPTSGAPMFPNKEDKDSPAEPLSFAFASPPRFGAASDQYMIERPDVSLKSVSIKVNQFKGIATSQTVEIELTVHRPQALFEGDLRRESWSSLLTNNIPHVLEYGWSGGGSNPLMNGQGYEDHKNGNHIIVPAKRRVSFNLISFDFSIGKDGQMDFVIKAVDNGFLYFRTAPVTLDTEVQKNENGELVHIDNTYIHSNSEIHKDRIKKLQDIVNNLKVESSKKPGPGDLISFREICNKFFAPVLDTSLKVGGYKEVNLYLGQFNKKAGWTSKNYGGINMSATKAEIDASSGIKKNSAVTGKSIGDFLFPKKWLLDRFKEFTIVGESISVINFVSFFLGLFNNPDSWDVSMAPVKKTKQKDEYIDTVTPLIKMKLQQNNNGSIDLFIVDVRAEVSDLNVDDAYKNSEKTLESIKQTLEDRNVPYLKLGHANSYVLEPKFTVNPDDTIRSILIKKAHKEFTDKKGVSIQTTEAIRKDLADPNHYIYAASIVGELKMIGNFAFDTFSLVWIDFGIKQWSGTFYVNERVDYLSREGFTTSVNLVATGSDPLGTQGRKSTKEATQENANMDFKPVVVTRKKKSNKKKP